MKHVLDLVSGAARIFALSALTFALAGCMIVSKEPLVGDTEGATPLPPTTYLFGYDEAPDGYTRNKEPPMALTLSGTTYSTADGSLNVQFVPIEGSDKYLLSIVSPDGSMYGAAKLKDGLLEVSVIVGDSDPANTLEALKAAGGDAAVLADATVEDGGISVTSRAALDYLIKLHAEGKLNLAGMVMYTGDTADAAAPATIVKDGDFWKAGS